MKKQDLRVLHNKLQHLTRGSTIISPELHEYKCERKGVVRYCQQSRLSYICDTMYTYYIVIELWIVGAI